MAEAGVFLHDMPQDRLAADLDHRLGLELGFLRDAGAEAARKQYYLHVSFSSNDPPDLL